MKRTHKSFMSLLTLLLIGVFLLSSITPVTAYAKVTYANSSKANSSKKKSERYFSDVKSKVQYRSEIEWLAQRGAFKSIAKKGKKFKPNSIITRKQVGIILDNLYGDKIDIVIKNPSKKATQGFMTEILTTVSTQLGRKITWNGGMPKAKITRAGACYLIRLMMTSADGDLDP